MGSRNKIVQVASAHSYKFAGFMFNFAESFTALIPRFL